MAVICQRCGTVFCWDDASEAAHWQRRLYCSENCKGRARRKRASCPTPLKEPVSAEWAARLNPQHFYRCSCGAYHRTRKLVRPEQQPGIVRELLLV